MAILANVVSPAGLSRLDDRDVSSGPRPSTDHRSADLAGEDRRTAGQGEGPHQDRDALAVQRRRLPMVAVDPQTPGGQFRPYGRPTAQWSRIKAGHSDDLGTSSEGQQ